MDTLTFSIAVLGMLASAVFFTGGKVVMARWKLPWTSYWMVSLLTCGVLGLMVWGVMGAPTVGWRYCFAAGILGSLAHVFANLALSWGEASLLVPLSGAKPLVLLGLVPLFESVPLPAGVAQGCLAATVGVALLGLTPRQRHGHALRPGWAVILMLIAMIFMCLSDLVGKRGMEQVGASGRIAGIAIWNSGLGLLPLVWLLARCPTVERTAALVASGLGILFAIYVALLATAIAIAPDRISAVAAVNVVISCRGAVAILLVMALDHWLRLGLEPVPRWIHGVRFVGALVLVGAVLLVS